jgi:ketosteroid isomerase-like protein
MMMRLVLLAVSVVCFGQTKAEIQALDTAWSDAIVKKDGAALEKLLADDLVYAHATGIVDTKRSYIDKIMGGKQVYKSFEQRKPTINLHGDAAVTHSWVRVTGVNQAGPFDDKIMLLHVWVKKGGMWQLAGHQTTKVEKLP